MSISSIEAQPYPPRVINVTNVARVINVKKVRTTETIVTIPIFGDTFTTKIML